MPCARLVPGATGVEMIMTSIIIAACAVPPLAAFVALARGHTVTIYGAWEQVGTNRLCR